METESQESPSKQKNPKYPKSHNKITPKKPRNHGYCRIQPNKKQNTQIKTTQKQNKHQIQRLKRTRRII